MIDTVIFQMITRQSFMEKASLILFMVFNIMLSNPMAITIRQQAKIYGFILYSMIQFI